MIRHDVEITVTVRVEGDDLDRATAHREARDFVDWFLKGSGIGGNNVTRMLRRSAARSPRRHSQPDPEPHP